MGSIDDERSRTVAVRYDVGPLIVTGVLDTTAVRENFLSICRRRSKLVLVRC
jgi:hypothetical protein